VWGTTVWLLQTFSTTLTTRRQSTHFRKRTFVDNARHISVDASTIAFNPRWRGSPRTISIKFYLDVKVPSSLGSNITENFNRPSWAHERYRRQTDRRQTDGRQHIANGKQESYAYVFTTRQSLFEFISACSLTPRRLAADSQGSADHKL